MIFFNSMKRTNNTHEKNPSSKHPRVKKNKQVTCGSLLNYLMASIRTEQGEVRHW